MGLRDTCSHCRRTSELTPVKFVTSSFYGEMKMVNKELCEKCINTEFFYVDNNGTVKFDTIRTETTSSIGDNNERE